MYPYADCNIIQSGQDMETKKAFFDGCLDRDQTLNINSSCHINELLLTKCIFLYLFYTLSLEYHKLCPEKRYYV